MLRLAQFGLGSLGRLELDALAGFEDVAVVAGADPVADAREAVASDHEIPVYAEYETLLAEHGTDLDAVTVVTPHALHYEQTTAALERSCAVHVEKPMVTDVADATALVEAAEARDGVVQVGYQRRFDPRFQRLREVVRAGEIGEVVGATSFLGQDWIAHQGDSWRTDPALSGGGQLYDSGSHLLDALLWVTGAEPRSVSAAIERGDHDVDVHASLTVTLERADRTIPASVFVTGGGQAGPGPREELVVWGTEGSVEYDADGVVVRREGEEPTREEIEAPDFEALTERKLRAFVEAVAGERANPVPPEAGAAVIALTEAAYRAAETGERVDVERPTPTPSAPERVPDESDA